MSGTINKTTLNAPFCRMHKNVEEYAGNLSTYDDVPLYQTDTYERLKPFIPSDKDVVGTTTLIPMDDNDEILHFYDIQGESLYTNPPNPNYPTIDHGLEEDEIWAFKLTNYNQIAIENKWVSDPRQ